MSVRRRLKGAWIAPVAFLLDQLSKRWILSLEGPVVRPSVVTLRATANTGMAFSLLSGRAQLLSVVTLLVLVALAAWLVVRPDDLPSSSRFGLWMVLGGGVGNLLDRLRLGQVVDFIDLSFVRFAVFNVADIFIVCGAALTAIALLIHSRKEADHAQ